MFDSPNYFHGYSPLTIRWALDAHCGLKAVWAFMAGSPLIYPEKWEPYRAVLHSPGSFTLGISTTLGKTSTSRVMNAYFGEADQGGGAITIGDEQPWELNTHPPGCGTIWRPASLFMWGGDSFAWPGADPSTPWPDGPGLFAAWGDPGLSGLPRPAPRSTDPLEKVIPPPLAMGVEESGLLGWVAPLGVPSATLPKRMG